MQTAEREYICRSQKNYSKHIAEVPAAKACLAAAAEHVQDQDVISTIFSYEGDLRITGIMAVQCLGYILNQARDRASENPVLGQAYCGCLNALGETLVSILPPADLQRFAQGLRMD